MSAGWRKPTSVTTAVTGAAVVVLFVQPDRSTRVKTAEPTSQFPASVWTIRNQKDRAVARHGCCTGLAEGFQVENGSKFHIGRNLPIFGKVLIVAAASLALSGHDLRVVPLATTVPAEAYAVR